MRPVILFFLALAALTAAGCSTSPTHNPLGGYRDACGELPGLIGDDC